MSNTPSLERKVRDLITNTITNKFPSKYSLRGRYHPFTEKLMREQKISINIASRVLSDVTSATITSYLPTQDSIPSSARTMYLRGAQTRLDHLARILHQLDISPENQIISKIKERYKGIDELNWQYPPAD